MRPVLNVLSLFDGIAGGYEALEREGYIVNEYYASEIDPYAISIARYNHPDIIQLGDILNWREWNIDWENIDLVIAGSPCTNLSRAGNGQGLKGDQSKLFWTFVDIWKHVQKEAIHTPYFLLENVKMKKEWRDVMSEAVGVEPVLIDSALVSAQRRERLYWTNIPNIRMPEDRGIMLRDVLFTDVVPMAIHNIYGGWGETSLRIFLDKSPTIRANSGGGSIPSALRLEALAISDRGIDYMNRTVRDGRNHWDFKHHSDITEDKSATVVANWAKGVPYNVLKDENYIREFHPVEVERLQTYPDFYTECGVLENGRYKKISKTQRLRALGNSFTVEVVAHLLHNLWLVD